MFHSVGVSKNTSRLSDDATTVPMSPSPVVSPSAKAGGAGPRKASSTVGSTRRTKVSMNDVVATPNEASTKMEVYWQLRSFNKPGLKEA